MYLIVVMLGFTKDALRANSIFHKFFVTLGFLSPLFLWSVWYINFQVSEYVYTFSLDFHIFLSGVGFLALHKKCCGFGHIH